MARSRPNARELLVRYDAAKEHFRKEYYPWVHDNSPYFTDHGIGHVESVMTSASTLLAPGKDLDEFAVFLLLSAILFHDVGMVIKRSGHADASTIAAIIDPIRKIVLPDVQSQRFVTEIVKAHSGQNPGLEAPRFTEETTLGSKNYLVPTRALAGVLRFADEVSENKTRISQEILPLVPPENAPYWHYADVIQSSRPDPSRRRVVMSLEMEAESAVTRYVCPKECAHLADENGTISLIEYIVFRLEKANQERVYCSSAISRFCLIDEIEVHFTLTIAGSRVPAYDDYIVALRDGGLSSAGQYRTIPLFDEFFQENPRFTPTAIAGVI